MTITTHTSKHKTILLRKFINLLYQFWTDWYFSRFFRFGVGFPDYKSSIHNINKTQLTHFRHPSTSIPHNIKEYLIFVVNVLLNLNKLFLSKNLTLPAPSNFHTEWWSAGEIIPYIKTSRKVRSTRNAPNSQSALVIQRNYSPTKIHSTNSCVGGF